MSVIANVFNASTDEGRIVMGLAAQLADASSSYKGEDAIIRLFVASGNEFDRATFISVMADSVAAILIASKKDKPAFIPASKEGYILIAERLAKKTGRYCDFSLINAISQQVKVVFDLVATLPEDDRLIIEAFTVL